MRFLLHHLPEVIAFGAVVLVQFVFVVIWLRRNQGPEHRRRRLQIFALYACSVLVLAAGLLVSSARVQQALPALVGSSVRIIGTCWALLSLTALIVCAIIAALPRPRPEHSTARRSFLLAARTVVVGVPAVAATYGVFIERRDLRLKEVDLAIPGLPRDLEGLRIVQLTDIHLSAFLSSSDLRRAVDMANETKPHLALVTGDLITGRGDPLDACIAELKRLRSDAGVLGCHGNHEVYAKCLQYVTVQGARIGIDFLRSRNHIVRFGSTPINFAGVDYQRFRTPYLVKAERLVVPGMMNVLLSHNPDVFPVAAQKGFEVTISGHTHGGQIGIEILDQPINFARFYTPYIYGSYRLGNSVAYVGRGIGTVGVPARVGAPPEVALIRLCAT